MPDLTEQRGRERDREREREQAVLEAGMVVVKDVWVCKFTPWTYWTEFSRALLKELPRVGAGGKETQHKRLTRYPKLRKGVTKPGGEALPASSKLQLEVLVTEALETITNVSHEKSPFWMSSKSRATSTGQENKGHLTLWLFASHPPISQTWERPMGVVVGVDERGPEGKQHLTKAPPASGFQA